MNSEAKNEIGADHNNGQALAVREPATLALKELEQLGSGGPMTQEALDTEVVRIVQKKLQPHGCDLVVRRVGGGISRLVIKVPGGEIRLRSSLEFLPSTPTNSETEAD